MIRREFITLLGGAVAAWPLAAHAQQPAMPVMGFLYSLSPEPIADRLRGFRQGLREAGFVEGENVTILFRWAENQIDRLPALATDLVRRQVAVIAAGNSLSAFALKAATATTPIVFSVNEDPVRLGLVTSLARPSGNMTGINFVTSELAAKRLELLRELVPAAIRVAVFVNPANAANTETALRDVAPAARALGMISRKWSKSLGVRSSFKFDIPVVLPPGRAKLATRPAPTALVIDVMTIGIAAVARCAARTALMVVAKMTSALRSTSSRARAGKRS